MKYRHKPIIKEAVQFNGLDDYLKICDLAKSNGQDIYKLLSYETNAMFIETLEGRMKAISGDWIIFGVNGELYPCKPDIFEESYEKVNE